MCVHLTDDSSYSPILVNNLMDSLVSVVGERQGLSDPFFQNEKKGGNVCNALSLRGYTHT